MVAEIVTGNTRSATAADTRKCWSNCSLRSLTSFSMR